MENISYACFSAYFPVLLHIEQHIAEHLLPGTVRGTCRIVHEIEAHFIVYDSDEFENRYLDEEYTLNP